MLFAWLFLFCSFKQYRVLVLLQLSIQNYAIITEVTIKFSAGFNIITGETGAGKSILLGALSLILGERADTNTLLDKEKKCVIEGLFDYKKKNLPLAAILQELDIDDDEELIIRREIAPNGKSRAFINDTPVNLTQIKQVTGLLVDLHQQFDTLEVGEENFQRQVLDAIATNAAMLQEYATAYKQYTTLKKEIDQLQQEQAKAQQTIDYNTFLYNELEEANLQPDELEQLNEELKLLNNAEHIKNTLNQISTGLANSDAALRPQIKQMANSLRSLSSISKSIEEVYTRLNAASIEIDDIAAELDSINDGIIYNAERIQTINDKIDLGYRLLKKHGVQSTNDLLAIQLKLEAAINQVAIADNEIAEKEKVAVVLMQKATALAKELHAQRQKHTVPFAKQVNELLHKVGMPNAAIKIEVTEVALNEHGCSKIAFLFNANVTSPAATATYEPIRKVASGGELSRLMLCIKSLVAGAIQLPVLIFDEIDTGISGEAARQVGIIMESLAKQHQVICITHQAQIAAKANTHYYVYKGVEKEAIKTSIKTLTTQERITAIAQMLSGERPTEAALQNAREMVQEK
jgi:DNA repair protein RecN (Recombination protein N)